jgi:serine protease Do
MLLRIARSGLAFLRPAAELSPATGARVLALGRGTLEPDSFVTVTDGLLSAVFPASGNYAPILQATAQTLPSMGGGPLLLESTGEFVGINSQRVVSRSGGYSLTFATPVSIYPRIAGDLLRVGRVERAVLGVSAAAVTEEMRATLGLPRREGVLLTTVRPHSAAERAGLERGDIVLTVNGRTVAAMGDLFGAVDAAPVGTTHTITYVHLGKILTTQATSELAPHR